MTDDRVREARRVVENYVEPHLGMPLGEAKAVKSVRLEGGTAVVEVELGFPAGRYGAELAAALERHLAAHAGRSAPARVEVTLAGGGPGRAGRAAAAAGHPQRHRRGVRQGRRRQVHHGREPRAGAWRSTGARVGLLDADIYGPSQPRMMGLQGERPASRDGKRLEPLEAHGVQGRCRSAS